MLIFRELADVCLKRPHSRSSKGSFDGSVVDECLWDMKCTVHDLEVMGSNTGRVELWVRSTSV